MISDTVFVRFKALLMFWHINTPKSCDVATGKISLISKTTKIAHKKKLFFSCIFLNHLPDFLFLFFNL